MRKTPLYLFLAAVIIAAPEKYTLVYVQDITSENVSALTTAGFELDHSFNFAENRLELALAFHRIPQLEEIGIPFTIAQEDLEAYYRSRLITDPSRDFEFGSMGGYYTYEEISQQLDEIHDEYPDLVGPKFSIGTSQEGLQIWGIKLSDYPTSNEPEPEILYTGLHHSREPMSYMNLFYYMYWLCENYLDNELARNILDNRELFFIPAVNPDGLVFNQQISPNGGGMQRKNRLESCANENDYDQWDGVDLNRNYSYYWGYDNIGSSSDGCLQTFRGQYAFSEPETQAVRDFVQMRNFTIALNYHSYSNLLIHPFGWEPNTYPPDDDLEIFIEFGSDMTQYNGYLMGTGMETVGYTVNGEACDWMYGEEGIIAFTPEIGSFSDGFWPPTDRIIPLAEENLYPNQFVALAGGSYYTVELTSQQGNFEAGGVYPLHLFIRNRGLTASSGEIRINLTTGSSFTLQESEFTIGMLDRRTEIYLDHLVDFSIDENIPSGTLETLEVTVQDDDGIVYTDTYEIVVGIPQILVNQPFENVNNDWTVGTPSDDATSGIWEWGNPNETSQSGNIIQPGDDHTPAGTNCFITGNSVSTSVGFDDVDGGKTSLYSPLVDLGSETGVLLSYWRWYSNELGDNPETDRWIVEYTNNAGSDWYELENTTIPERNWVEKQFFLSEPQVDLTPFMQFRFIAEDIYHEGDNGSGGSLVEAALDDFTLSIFEETPILIGDVNGDTLINVVDILLIVNHILENMILIGNQFEAADMDQNSEINVLDVVQIVAIILGDI